jgi:catechol 2,3-dioxygenase-like lactoylglutathione lyase family enzyme
MRLNYAIVFVSDMKKAVAFYRDVVGLPLRFESPDWTEFATEGATLALHIGEAGRCRPGFAVPDLAAFHKKMMEEGVRCIEEPKEVFGSRIAQYADRDGLPFSVSQQRVS